MPLIYSRLQCKHAVITKCSKTLCITFFRSVRKISKSDYSFVISLRLSVCPSVRTEHLGSHSMAIHEIQYLGKFSNV